MSSQNENTQAVVETDSVDPQPALHVEGIH